MDYLTIAKEVLLSESRALIDSSTKLKNEELNSLVQIFEQLIREKGSLVFCGVGKSGYIGQKLASTFCSLGLPSFFLHPVEALHGDLGRVGEFDSVVFISKSGTTEEIIKLLPFLPNKNGKKIGLLGATDSPIAKKCEVLFDCSISKEACLNNQAPTTSSTLTMGMGHAMAVVFQNFVGLSKEKFASNHPGGILGKSLRMKVQDLMIPPDFCPVLQGESTLQDAIVEMSKFPVGGCAILGPRSKLIGIIVEGDIRRAFAEEGKDALLIKLVTFMNKDPVEVGPKDLAFRALDLMENRNKPISILPVVKYEKFQGFIRLHDLLKEGFLSQKKDGLISPIKNSSNAE